MNAVFHLINEMSPYLLLGFLLAGVLHAFIPGRYYHRFLSKPTFGSVVNAALLGVPLPLCSCGVIPTAMSLRKEGASQGATTSFLIATPQTGIDSILATYGLMGLPFAIIRPVAALVTALFGGFLQNVFNRGAEPTDNTASAATCPLPETEKRTLLQRVGDALRYAYVEMMRDIGRWLLIGLVAAALITLFVPDELFSVFRDNTFASMLLVLCIAVPMYLCATGSIPLAVALMMKGLTPGAGLVLLMAGPACNIASMLVVKKVLGTRSLVIYLASIVLGAVGFGCLIDLMQQQGWVDFLGHLGQSAGDDCCHEVDSWFSWLCTAVLALLLLNALVLSRLFHRKSQQPTQNHTEMNNCTIYLVEGMDCGHCRAAVEKALQNVPGVTHVTVNLETKQAVVDGTADEAALRQAVEEVGFKLVRL